MSVTDQEWQVDALYEMLDEDGGGEPLDIRIRRFAEEAVANDLTYIGGYLLPVVTRRNTEARWWTPEDGALPQPRSTYHTIEIRLHPTLREHPQHAQLIAEEIIREQWPGNG